MLHPFCLCALLPAHGCMLTSCTLQLCRSKVLADSCTVILNMAHRNPHHHTHTHNWPIWKLKSNIFLLVKIKYADHMRLNVNAGPWFTYTQYRSQFISAKTNTSARGERWCQTPSACVPVSMIDGCAADRANSEARPVSEEG